MRRLRLREGNFVHTLGPRRRFGAVFEALGEDHEICGRKSETPSFDHYSFFFLFSHVLS